MRNAALHLTCRVSSPLQRDCAGAALPFGHSVPQDDAVTCEDYAQRLAEAVVSDLQASLENFAPLQISSRALPSGGAIEVRVRRRSDGAEEAATYSIDE